MKYKALLEGLEISEVTYLNMVSHTLSSRLDSEFFKKEYLYNDVIVNKSGFNKLLKITNKINVGFVGSMVNHYVSDGTILLQTKNIGTFFILDNDTIKITPEFHKQLKKSQIKNKDILIARSGSFGKASIYLENTIINSSDIIIVEVNENLINPHYLVSFLNSKYGINQMIRFASGGLQGHVNLTILEELEVPRLSFIFQLKIEKMIELSYNLIKKSKHLYTEAENLLLEELDLADYKPTEENISIKSLKDSFLDSGRLDSEYYQPKYDELEKKIKKNAQYTKIINDIKSYNSRGLQPKYLSSGDLDVINSRHILDKTLDYDNFEKTNILNWDLQKKARIFYNDILTYTTGANIGRTQIYQKEQKALASNHVNILRIKSENAKYVAFLMNSFIGKMQTEKLCAGSAQVELYPKDIDKFIIPFISQKSQTIICNNIDRSFELKEKSKKLLDIAKVGVEMAIENSEDKAMEWMEREVKEIGLEV